MLFLGANALSEQAFETQVEQTLEVPKVPKAAN